MLPEDKENTDCEDERSEARYSWEKIEWSKYAAGIGFGLGAGAAGVAGAAESLTQRLRNALDAKAKVEGLEVVGQRGGSQEDRNEEIWIVIEAKALPQLAPGGAGVSAGINVDASDRGKDES
jgi:hypothetical protein